MKYLPLFLFLFLCTLQLNAQEEESKRKYTSAELLSDYYDEGFNPFNKGRWFTKLALSLQDEALDNVPRLLDRVVEGDDFSWKIDVSGGRYLSDYFLAGLSINYGEKKFVGTVIDSNSDTVRSESISRDISFVPFIRTSIPLTKNQRLSFFNDIRIGLGFGNTLKRSTKNQDEVQKEFGDVFIFSVGLTPGITFFAVESFAFEVGINLIGYKLEVDNTTTNGVEASRKVSHDINFRINLLSLDFGVAYFFGAKKQN